MAVDTGTGLRMLPGRVLVRPESDAEWTQGGLYIPNTAREAPQIGVVVATGAVRGGVGSELREGDTVFFGRYSGTVIYVEGEELLVIRESDILAVLREPELLQSFRGKSDKPLAGQRDTMPVHVFFGEDFVGAEERIRHAVQKIAEVLNFEISDEQPAARGSIFKKFILSARSVSPEGDPKRTLANIGQSLDSLTTTEITPPLSQGEAEAVSALLRGLARTADAVLVIGPLLVVKMTDPIYGERILAKTLTAEQLRMINENPALWTSPAAMMAQLDTFTQTSMTRDNFKF